MSNQTPPRLRLLGRTALVSVLALAAVPNVLAQQDPQELELDAEEIIITGSRIVRDGFTAPTPITVLSSEEIQASGSTDIAALLRENPALNSSLTADQSFLNAAPTGVGLLNLRGLGTERTLTLVNGRRHVSGISGSAAVDVSTIPVSLIERVETLTGSTSAIYGADAVTGVVNFILKDDFEGLTYRAQGGITEEGDGEEYLISATAGTNFADGRGNAVVSIEYNHSEEILVADRPGFAGPGLANEIVANAELIEFIGGDNPDALNVFARNTTLPVSSENGIIFLQDADDAFGFGPLNILFPGTVGGFPTAQIVGDDGTLRPFNPGDVFVDLFNAVGGDGVPTNPAVGYLQPKSDRLTINANTKYSIIEGLDWFAEAKFSYTDTFAVNQVNGFNDDIPIALDNPFIPDALRAQIDSIIDQGITPQITVSRDNLEVPFTQATDRYTFRVVTGFEGELSNGWNYEISYNFGRTDADIVSVNSRLEDRYFAAIDAVEDPETGEIVCRSDIDPDATPPIGTFPPTQTGFFTFQPGDGQCAPLNIFGFGNGSEEAEAFIFQPTTDAIKTTQQVVSGYIAGDTEDFFELPAGPVAFATGFEYREEKSDFRPDNLEISRLLFDNLRSASEPTSGRFDVWEVYGETQIPVLTDKPFAEELSISGAVRYSDYSTIGSTTTWSVGGTWQPISDIRFRSSFGRAIRAPNINELFSPPQPIFIAADFDPCNASQITQGSEFREQNCLELVGPGFNSTDFNTSFVTGRAGGNPDLIEERAETFTLGVVVTPSITPGLSVSIDYYDVEITDAIIVVQAERIIENCVDAPTLDNQFCELVTRDPVNGNITTFESGEQNVAALESRGVDFAVRYDFDLDEIGLNNWGTFTASFNGTRNLRRADFPFQEFPDEIDDELREFTFPKWIVNANFDWTWGDLTLGWQTRYQSSQFLPGIERADIESDPNAFDPFTTGDAFVHDFSISYDVFENLRVYGGVDNVADRDPFLASLTRPIGFRGRSFFLGVSGNF